MLSWLQFRRRNPSLPRTSLLLWWTCVPLFVGSLMRLIWRLRVQGRHRIPREGPALVICNHQSHLDPMILGCVLADRGPRMMARASLLTDSPWPLPWMLKNGFRIIPIDRDAVDPGAMRAAITELQEGRLSIVFPEGTRSEDGHLQEFRRGVWLLIKRGCAPVLPMAIEGTFDIWPRGRGPQTRGRMMVVIGEPIAHDTLLEMGPEEGLRFLAAQVESLRAEAMSSIRARSGGRWPGPRIREGDTPCTAGK